MDTPESPPPRDRDNQKAPGQPPARGFCFYAFYLFKG